MCEPLTITIRTADRSPRPNYLGRTVRSLLAAGVAADRLHLVLTDPDVRWLEPELGPALLAAVTQHIPGRRRSPNVNGVAQLGVLAIAPAAWLLMLEDDLEVCQDFAGSVVRWLTAHRRADVHVYRFCGFGSPAGRWGAGELYPLREQRGSQAIALAAADAGRLARWAAGYVDVYTGELRPEWRPAGAPFRDRPAVGFDKLVGYGALAAWPADRYSVVSRPHLVRHIGRASSIAPRGFVPNDGAFAAAAWGVVGWAFDGL
jgi:hypothetical protein